MKKKILLSCLLSLSIVACTSPILNNTSQYSDLDQEYSQFKTQALTQSYLKKKMDKWLSDGKYSKNLVREIEYAKFKHPTLLKDIVSLEPAMFNSIAGNTGVSQKRTEPSFENYIEYIDPFPSDVTATGATSITSSSFTANWNSVTNATGYKLYIDGSATPITLGLVTSYNATGLTAGISHNYYVKSVNNAGESQASNSITVDLPSNLLAPISTYSSLTTTSYTASWSSVNGATGYKLYLDGSETPIILGNVTSYSVTGLVYNSSHNFKVVATNSSGDSVASNIVSITLLTNTPVALEAGNITTTSYIAKWNTVLGATTYHLYLDGNNTPISLAQDVSSYSVSNLLIGSSHNYIVKAVNSIGRESASSNIISVTLLTNSPTALSPTNRTQTSYTANWTSVTDATGYKLYLDGNVTPIILGAVTSYDVSGLSIGSGHSYYLKSILNTGDSQASNTISFYTTFDEFKVSATYGSGNFPSMDVTTDGKFIIAFSTYSTNNDIFLKRYDSNGIALGSEAMVNTYTTNSQDFSSIATASDGSFIVTWSGSGSGAVNEIYAQRYNTNGSKNGSEFKISTNGTFHQKPSISIGKTDGKFVIAWESYGQDGDNLGIYAQRYNSDASKDGSEFQVNTLTTNRQNNPKVAINNNGSFIITWDSNSSAGANWGIRAQKYNADGTTNGSEFRVNTYSANYQEIPAIAMANDGSFIIAWECNARDGDQNGYYNIYAQRFDTSWNKLGSEFRVNTLTAGTQESPSIAMNKSNGNFIISWMAYGTGTNYGIRAQKYNTDGTTNGSEFRVNTITTNYQYYPVVKITNDGNFVFTWESITTTGSLVGAYAKRYDSNGNVL